MFSLTIAPLFHETPPSRLPLHPSVFLGQIEARRAEKNRFWGRAPSFDRLWISTPPPDWTLLFPKNSHSHVPFFLVKNVFPMWNAISHRCICNLIMKHSSCQKPRLLQGLIKYSKKGKKQHSFLPVVIRVIRKNHEFTNTDAEQLSEVIIVVWLD